MTRVAVGLVLATMFLGNAPASGEIYRWVDDHGITHLDDTLDNVPETARPAAKVFQARTAPRASAIHEGPTQAAFANGVARELGLIATETQDAVSALHIVGVYPSAGWNPTMALSSVVIDEVTRAARTAARAHRLPQSEFAVEAAVLRVSTSLGIAGPPPAVVAEPAPAPAPPTIVVAPNIIVEAPPATVVVRTIEREPVLTPYGFSPGYGAGVLFAPIPSRSVPGPIPERITPLTSPVGRLHGPAVPPRPGLGPIRRPVVF